MGGVGIRVVLAWAGVWLGMEIGGGVRTLEIRVVWGWEMGLFV